MHIAFISPEYPHASLNKAAGLGTSIKNLALELIRNNHKVTVFVYGQIQDKTLLDEGITIYAIRHRKYIILGWFLYRKYLEKYINLMVLEKDIDVLEAPDWTGVTAFMNLNRPLVIRLHGSDGYFCHLGRRKQKWKNYFFEKKALEKATKIVSVSAFTADKTKEIFSLKTNIQVIHNGIDVSAFKPQDGKIVKNEILYFGSIIRKKGVLELAMAFNILVEMKEDVTLTLLGRDTTDVFEKRSTLDMFFDILSENAKTKVKYLKEVPYAEVVQIINRANLVTLPSFAEALPMSWLEAMAMEKAMITSNIGWSNEIMIDGKTGFTVNPKNHLLYAEKMKQLLEDNVQANTYGRNARTLVKEKFESGILAKNNIELYIKLTNFHK
ncbi:glycosyltransferase family 4 protein [Flavivirga aquimarina]|uniref:Glycosyltransferase family 4 protein n=1 Tax=Flavivirga aquimarina TaxID=2027862 RepID=A0ABT8WBV7_9FLAO|nr:glycosyltransferase family 4 protein [Flavivirga aquimarina]MDO5970552.1 glycosyltransferase family 4 protein [Flavivirga aquimarina]